MDGPSINLKFYQELSTRFKENNSHSLLDIGSCSLHIVDRSFTRKTRMEVEEFIKRSILCSP